MAFNFGTQLFKAFVLFAILSQVIAHSYVTSPISRSDQAQDETGCRGPACLGPCDIPLAQATRAPITAARGSSITVEWPRNNHAGGFIRFAWAPTAQSDEASVFDSNVQQINCHEVGGCGPSDPSDPNGGDNGPADGSSMACTTTLNVPETLADGEWTLQWAWFGGAFSLGDYYSCVDYTISGGPTGSFTPAFVGGDFTYPGQQKCKFFNTNALHMCVDEPCNNPIFTLSQEQSGTPAAGQIGTGLASSASASPATPVTPVIQPSTSTSTTGAKVVTSTSTTGTKVVTSTSTTGKKATSTGSSKTATSTSTTGSKAATSTSSGSSTPSTSTSTSTTGYAPVVVPTPTPTPTPVVVSPNQACTLGYEICVGSTQYQTCTNGRDATYWAPPQSCQSGLVCNPSGNYVYCIRP